ncbi:MAG: MXAN_5187 C-terminal domain-containing protein [Myxococcota bacterium]|nr:MXAN_5187 C-terminal domain-containing protein [Myxococcota bacterium]
MAKVQKKDVKLNNKFEELERKMFLLKIQYEKYFSGLERIEPLKEREDLRRFVRELMQEPITNTMQKHKFRTLKARYNSMELYWQRNITMIERGTHPKMKFRTNRREQQQRDAAIKRQEMADRRKRFSDRQKQELAYKSAFDTFIEARNKCGQSTDLSYNAIKESLSKQVRSIKSQYKCDRVKFRVSIEGGKAKMKAVPVRDEK